MRLSITDKCDLGCTCCVGYRASVQRADAILTVSEIAILVRAFAHNGVTKVRLSGGEPLLREDVVEVVRRAVDLILTTGGTGLALRDRTPEATLAVLDSSANGIAEAIRYEGLRHTPNACLSRAVSGLRGRTLIVNLPGSTRAIEQSLALLRSILPHALQIIRSEVADCGRKNG